MNKVPEKRGIIIMDTGFIIRASVPLPNQFVTEQAKIQNKPVRLMDALILLAKNGYEVTIPAAVAYECGQFLQDGSNVQDNFNNVNKSTYTKLTKYILQNVNNLYKNGADIKIAMPPERDHSEAAEFVRKINDVHTSNLHTVDKVHFFTTIKNPLGSQFGDIAARELIKSMPKTNTPVFYLSDDGTARDTAASLRDDLTVNRLNTAGFFSALANNDILAHVGIKNNNVSSLYFRDIINYIHEELLRLRVSKDSHASYLFKRKTDLAPSDTQETQTTPFEKSMIGIKEVLSENLQPKKTEEYVSANNFSHDRIAKFNAKYKPQIR